MQHQSLPAATHFAIDTEVWLRTLVLEGRPQGEPAPHPRWATKDYVHDEALAWFLEHYADIPLTPAARAGGAVEDLTFWLDSRLLERARQLATRNGMRLAQLIERALTAYVATHIPPQLMRFRRRVQLDAQRLHEGRAVPPVPAAHAAPVRLNQVRAKQSPRARAGVRTRAAR